MNWFKHLNEALEYIEEHLTDEINLKEVALKAYSSYHHFLRMFFILSGIPMSEYIRKRRLTMAASDVLSTDDRIIDIAYKYQYNTPEAFTKAFKEFHGVTPRDARKYKGVLKSCSKLSFQLTVGGFKEMDYKMVHKDKLNFRGYSIDVSTENGENYRKIPAFWNEIMADGRCDRLFQNADEMGVCGICYGYDQDVKEFKYMIGVRNSNFEDEKAIDVSFGAETFAAFPAVGKLPDSIQKTTKYIFQEWFPSSNYEHTAGPELEVYPNGNPDGEDYVCYYWVPIKQK